MKTLVCQRLPCPSETCSSSDGFHIYLDKEKDLYDGYCFSCQEWQGNIICKNLLDKSPKTVYSISKGTIGYTTTINNKDTMNSNNYVDFTSTWRGLLPKTLKFFGVQYVPTEGTVRYPHGKDAYKVRAKGGKDFYWSGEAQAAPMFGSDKFSSAQSMTLTITEGQDDAMAVYQMMGHYPVVSVKSSGSAVKDISAQYDWVNSFDKIYLCFDNDKVGQKAAKQVAKLFNVNKVYHVQMDRLKDANEYLMDGAKGVKEFVSLWWNAKKIKPKGIVSSFDEIEKLLNKKDSATIAEYPFATLQEMTYGMREGESVLWKAQEKIGKVIQLNTPLPTPSGWTTIKDLQEGDDLIGSDGTTVKVTYITPVHTRPYYDVTFSDGTVIQAGDNHRWTVRNLNNRVFVTDTESMFNTPDGIIAKGSKAKFMVPCMEPAIFPEKDLPIDPYLLGIWLADGCKHNSYVTLSSKKLKLVEDYAKPYIRKESNDCFRVRFEDLTSRQLKDNDLYLNKHIPSDYLRSSLEQRQQLFDGLLFDGWSRTSKGKQENEYYSSDKALFDQVVELARSLGYIVTCSQRQGRYKNEDGGWVYCKQAYSFRYRKVKWKAIRSIVPIGEREGRCLTVDHPDHLFACGDGWTLTHNTEVMRAIEHHVLKTTDHNIGIIHLEEEERRSIQGLAGYDLKRPVHLPDSGVSNADVMDAYRKLVKRDDRVYYYTHFGSDDPDIILGSIRYLAAVAGCKIIFLDHISMVVSGHKDDGDERRKLDRISTELAQMCRELNFNLQFISHVNDDGKTRGSRYISKAADLIITLDRNTEAEDPTIRNKTKLVIEGNRYASKSGPAGNLYFNPETFCLTELSDEEVVIEGELEGRF